MTRRFAFLWLILFLIRWVQPAAAAGCSPFTPGLVAWWRGDGDPTDAFRRLDGTFVQHTAYAAGRSGNAFSFDGASWVEVPDAPLLNSLVFTAEAWVKPNALDGDVDIILNKELGPAGLVQFEFGIKGPLDLAPNQIPVGNLAFYLGGVALSADDYGGWVDGRAKVPLGEWTHVALVVDVGRVTTYVNGVATREVAYGGSVQPNPGPLRIGSRSPATVATYPTIPFNGLIDEVAFYSRALSAAEILASAQDGGLAACARDLRLAGEASLLMAPGEAATLKLDVTNVLGRAVPGVVLVCTLPVGVETLGAVATQGACTVEAGVVRCNLGEVAPGAAIQVSVDFKAGAPADLFFRSKLEVTGGDSLADNDAVESPLHIVPRTISAGGLTVSEPALGSADVTVLLNLSVPAKDPVTVQYATVNGTAIGGGDFVATEGTATFQPGEVEQRIVVRLIGDTIYESPEYFQIRLSEASTAIAPGSELVRIDILDDDPKPVLTVAPVSVREGDNGSRELEFLLRLSGAADAAVRVMFATTNGTAQAGTDYLPVSGETVFEAGQTEKSIKVAVLGDTVDEPNELFFLALDRPEGATVPEFVRTQIGASIIDDDAVGGQLDHFEVEVSDSTLLRGAPVPVGVKAIDGRGEVLTGYRGAVSLLVHPEDGPVDVVFTEISPLPFGFVELQNLGQSPVNLAGWRLTFYDGSLGPIPRATFVFPTATTGLGQVFTVRLGAGFNSYPGFFLGESLLWGRASSIDRSIPPMAVMLQDATGRVRDFFCAGPMQASDIALPVEVSREIWDGPSMAGEAPTNGTYQRFGNRLRRGPAAWTIAGLSRGSQNVGLVQPLPESSAILPQPSNATDFIDGVWNGMIAVDSLLQRVRLRADDGNGHSGTSQPFLVIPADDLSVGVTAAQLEHTATLMEGRYPVLRPIVFEVSVTNSGPTVSSNVVARLGTQLGLAVGNWISVTSSRGEAFLDLPAIAGCRFGDLEPGAVVTLKATYALTDTAVNLASPQGMQAIATVERAQPEEFTGNNTANLSFTVSQPCVPIIADMEPAAWWRAEGTAVDEWTGTDALLVGGLGYGPGRVGLGWLFNGADAGVLIPDSPSLRSNFVSGFTVDCWVRMSMNKGVAVLVDKREPGAVNTGYTVSIEASRLVLSVTGTSNKPGVWSLSTVSGAPVNRVSDGNWHHVAASVRPGSNSIVQLHFDGALVSEGLLPLDWGAITNSGPFRIGHRAASFPDGFLPGQIDELTVHRRVLSTDEIRAIVNAGGHGKCTSTLVVVPREVPTDGTSGVPTAFRYAVSNAGPFKAIGVQAQLAFHRPLGLGRVAVESSSGPSGPGSYQPETLSIPVGDLAVGASADIEAVVRSDASPLSVLASAGGVVEALSTRESFLRSAVHYQGVDSDGDGMEDEWEIEYGFEPGNPADGPQDLDGDGVSNWAEVIAGTSPRTAAQRLTLRVAVIDGGAAAVTFEGRAGRLYTLERSSESSRGEWTAIAQTGRVSEDAVRSLVDPTPPGGTTLYRLLVQR